MKFGSAYVFPLVVALLVVSADGNEQKVKKNKAKRNEPISPLTAAKPKERVSGTDRAKGKGGESDSRAWVPNYCKWSTTSVLKLSARETWKEVKSFGYDDGAYASDLWCRYRIQAPRDQFVEVEFLDIDITSSPSCTDDYLEVKFKTNGGPYYYYCGNTAPNNIYSPGRLVFLTLYTDMVDELRGKGFHIRYRAITSIPLTTTSSPTPTDPASTSTAASPSSSTPAPSGATPVPSTEAPTPASTTPPPPPDFSCPGGTKTLSGSQGQFASPDYTPDGKYELNVNCNYRITVPAGMIIKIEFTDLSLEASSACQWDSLTFYDGTSAGNAPLLGTFCGTTKSTIFTSTNEVSALFVSDNAVADRGFLATYEAIVPPDDGPGECGIPAIAEGRIVGGVIATPHSWPWQISLRFAGYYWNHWCGGSILTKDWVITAAHCVIYQGKVESPDSFKVKVGDHNQYTHDPWERTHDVAQVIVHEQYSKNGYSHDIALLRLRHPITLNSKAKPVCIPGQDPADNTLCATTGWGSTEGTSDNTYLNEVWVPTISYSLCKSWLGNTLTTYMICAGYENGGKDSCSGDSGGPLACEMDTQDVNNVKHFYLTGLTSWGYGCADARAPGVYTRVSQYVPWLENIIGSGSVPRPSK